MKTILKSILVKVENAIRTAMTAFRPRFTCYERERYDNSVYYIPALLPSVKEAREIKRKYEEVTVKTVKEYNYTTKKIEKRR